MAKAVPPPPPPPSAPIDINLRDALEERYLAYALSTIMGRALPDARDGLKPVHRRILYGMHVLKLDPGSAFKKCAKIVGDVMGSFHPHGDQAIYEALVRLAQDFTSRYPLIEGHAIESRQRREFHFPDSAAASAGTSASGSQATWPPS